MTFFDNLKNKLFKEETSGKGQESQPAGKSKDLQDKIKGLFAKKPDEVEQAVEDLDMSQESKGWIEAFVNARQWIEERALKK